MTTIQRGKSLLHVCRRFNIGVMMGWLKMTAYEAEGGQLVQGSY